MQIKGNSYINKSSQLLKISEGNFFFFNIVSAKEEETYRGQKILKLSEDEQNVIKKKG